MDPLSITVSVIAILDLTTKVFGYVNSVKYASKERRQCAMEMSSTLALLTELRYHLEDSSPNTPWFESVCALDGKDGPLGQYKAALKELEMKLEPPEGFKKAAKSLTWKLNKSESDSILSRIERLKSSIHIALELDNLYAPNLNYNASLMVFDG
ncbi:uncharacterized protein K452DRAFT_236179 [Aplosporella prunicola CBS 121167]|uniref:Fungal N-terminal domain-containing protein n=1 Tax=Aplosporella prunicola CBS 121167 TaxID=1176127 RepID=A0A6A6AZP7_9PEZI|nr:uncharacterized protein K452DRAFT_236179 [Aplosporella prunicola CBS 121167]KAF2137260.1 hypothetical protein K452DRAFT_236179 [Aplosporella prunicola CBS 121167]